MGSEREEKSDAWGDLLSQISRPESGVKKQPNFLARVGRELAYHPYIPLGIIMGAAVGGILVGVASLDQLLNPQIIDALRRETYWYQHLTVMQGNTPAILDHIREVWAGSVVVGAIGGAIRTIDSR